MKALTLRQPWAHAILHLGKNVENRSWAPPESLVGKYIAIHAGMAFVRDSGLPVTREELHFGAIVGVARIAGVVNKSRSRWFEGPFGWLLEDVRPLSKPISCKGKLGLWNVPPAYVRKIQRVFPDLELD